MYARILVALNMDLSYHEIPVDLTYCLSPVKLLTTLENVRNNINNVANRDLVLHFYEYLKSLDTSENYQEGIIKAILNFCEFIGSDKPLLEVTDKGLVLRFLD